MEKKGKFIVIDGADAVGKKTQAELLEARMGREGFSVARFAFPRYDKDSSYLVRIYLGRINPDAPPLMRDPLRLGPYVASLFYALDRREAASDILQLLNAGTNIICDRYVTANMGHQGGLIASAAERKRYYAWIRKFEYDINKLPKPDCTLFLSVPLDVATRLLNERLHQATLPGVQERKDSLDDIELQRRAHRTYNELARLYRSEFTVVECASGPQGELLTPADIHEKIWAAVRPLLLA